MRPRHGLLDRLPGQSRHDRRPSPARRITSSSTSTAMPRSTTAARWAMPRSSASATTTSRSSTSGWPASRRGRQAGRARGRLFDARRHRAAEGDGRGRQGRGRDGAGRRGPFAWASSARMAAASFEEAGRRATRSISSSAPSPSGRHGRRLLRLQPSQVRDAAPGLPPLCLHRLAAAVGGRHRRDLDPQADARRQQARPSLGEQQAPPRGPARRSASTSAPTTPQSAIIAVIMPDQQTRRAMWEALLEPRASTSTWPARRRRPPACILLRCSLCAEHSDEEVGQILEMFAGAGRATGVIG